MTLLWKCDKCGRTEAARKMPKGWKPRVRDISDGWHMDHYCETCTVPAHENAAGPGNRPRET